VWKEGGKKEGLESLDEGGARVVKREGRKDVSEEDMSKKCVSLVKQPHISTFRCWLDLEDALRSPLELGVHAPKHYIATKIVQFTIKRRLGIVGYSNSM
jgi:hypothetical protein